MDPLGEQDVVVNSPRNVPLATGGLQLQSTPQFAFPNGCQLVPVHSQSQEPHENGSTQAGAIISHTSTPESH